MSTADTTNEPARTADFLTLETAQALSPTGSAQAEKLSCKEDPADKDHVSGFLFVGADRRERPWGTSENAKIPTGHPPRDRRRGSLGVRGRARQVDAGDPRLDRPRAPTWRDPKSRRSGIL